MNKLKSITYWRMFRAKCNSAHPSPLSSRTRWLVHINTHVRARTHYNAPQRTQLIRYKERNDCQERGHSHTES